MLPLVQEERLTSRQRFEKNSRERWEAYWQDPPPDDPKRFAQVWAFLAKIQPSKTLDIGCGTAPFIGKLRGVGIDISEIPLEKQPVETKRQCFPYLDFKDRSFDTIICTDVIAELDPELHRLALSEIARLLKPDGWLVVSSPLDCRTVAPGDRFKALVATEFKIIEESGRHLRFGSFVEKITEVLLGDGGMTHLTLLAQKKALF